jgi:hypothetical protein
MAFNIIGKTMPVGLPGQVARESYSVIETHANENVTAYGVPVALASGGAVRMLTSTDTAASIYGWSVRPDAVQLGGANPAFGDSGIPDPKQPIDIMIKGYINVKVYGSTAPAFGGAVYVRNAAGSSGEPVGAAEAASGTGLVAANDTIFMGAKDDYDLAQIRVL